VFSHEFTIEWGDCDEAGIVFYPNYFYWFDCTFQRFTRERGLGQREIRRRFGAVTPIVDAGAQFARPRATTTRSWPRRRSRAGKRSASGSATGLTVGGTLVAEGFEVRAWAVQDSGGRLAAPRSTPSSAPFSRDGTRAGPRAGRHQALDAALALLRAMASVPGPAALSDLARAAGMPASKAHRYLASFVHAWARGAERAIGRYDLGPPAAELGLAALARHDAVNRAADALPELSAETGLTVLLTVWGNGGATVVRWERAASPVMTSFGLGSTLPLLTSASGRVFLAFLPRRLTEARLAEEVERARGLDIADLDLTPGGLEGLVEGIRRDGFATVDGRFVPGLRAIAAPVTNWAGEAEVAVTLIGTSELVVAPDSPARRSLLAFTRRLSIPSG
jgi:DNA-binding IclR family transcriptional regulator